MNFTVLDFTKPDASLWHLCAMTVMAKAPRPGRVKTRLTPPLTPEQASGINSCFLRDTTANLAELAKGGRSAGVISYTPAGDEALFEGLVPPEFRLILQRGDGFGERLFYTAEDLFACGFGAVCLIDSDSPTVPQEAFAAAVEALQRPGDRVVIGPSHDGGYYLIGIKAAHRTLFEGIAWSTATVCAETVAAAERMGLEVVLLPMWYDVDDAATLAILRDELIIGRKPSFAETVGYAAKNTAMFLREMAAI